MLLSSAVLRGEVGAAHVRSHCVHDGGSHRACDACEARWEVALATDALRRGTDELLVAADRVAMAMIRLGRSARAHQGRCVECRDIAIDAYAHRDELLDVIGRLLDDAALAQRLTASELREEFR